MGSQRPLKDVCKMFRSLRRASPRPCSRPRFGESASCVEGQASLFPGELLHFLHSRTATPGGSVGRIIHVCPAGLPNMVWPVILDLGMTHGLQKILFHVNGFHIQGSAVLLSPHFRMRQRRRKSLPFNASPNQWKRLSQVTTRTLDTEPGSQKI